MYSNESTEELTDKTYQIVDRIFSEIEKNLVINALINQCGNNLPLCDNWTPKKLERIRFAAIKYSNGKFDKLGAAIELANKDWRDLLVAEDFANDKNSHIDWANKILKQLF